MKARPVRWPRALRLSLVLVLVVAAACTKGAAQKSTASGGSAPIRLGFSAWPGWFPWQVAEEKGLFDDAGLDVKLSYFDSYTDSLNALNAGKLDGNSQTLNDTISSVAAGSKQVIVLVNDNSTGNDQIIVRPGINSIADLKGKKVAAEEGTVDHYLLLLGLDKAGLTQKDIDFKPFLTDAAAAAFVSGGVDAVGAFAPFTTTALQLPGSKALFTSRDFPGAIPDHLAMSKVFVDSRPDDVQKLVDVWFKTLDWIQGHKEEAVAIMARKGGVTPLDYETYEQGTHIFSVQENLDAFSAGESMANLTYSAKRIADFQKGAGLTATSPDLAGLFEDRFVRRHAGSQ